MRLRAVQMLHTCALVCMNRSSYCTGLGLSKWVSMIQPRNAPAIWHAVSLYLVGALAVRVRTQSIAGADLRHSTAFHAGLMAAGTQAFATYQQ